jgi:transposase
MIPHSKCKGEPAMKKNSICQQSSRKRKRALQGSITIGLDLGDKSSRYCVLDANGKVVEEGSLASTKPSLARKFGSGPRCRIAVEVGLLGDLGYEVIVANARQVQLISASSRKDDRLDAELLARLARADPQLLRPIRHRSEQAQADLLKVRVRATLVEARTALINAARGWTKAAGERLPACDADQVGVEMLEDVPAELAQALEPLVEQVESLTEKIRQCDGELEQIARAQYPETELLRQVSGVGVLIALGFVLTLEDPARFHHSRDVGCYVGLRPKRSASGESRPQLGISKEGDVYLRKLLVQGAHYILGWRGPDTDLRRWGQKLAARGGKNAKKRAVVAVARKLAVLLHKLWTTGEVYEPLRNAHARQRQPQAA